MEEQAQYRHIEELKTKLVDKRIDLEKQLEEVRKRYPLVALVLSMQAAAISEMAYLRYGEAPSIYSLLAETMVAYPQIVDPGLTHRFRECKRSLDGCLGRSRSYEEGASCFDSFSSCWRSAITYKGDSK